MGITHEVVNQSTTNAFGTLSSGWIPAESVQFYANGTLLGTFAANADGVLSVGITTGVGFGYIIIEEKGISWGLANRFMQDKSFTCDSLGMN